MNPHTPKKTCKAMAGVFCVVVSYVHQLVKPISKIFLQRETEHCFPPLRNIRSESRKRGLATSSMHCKKRLKSFQEFNLKITATQESFERVKRWIQVSPSVPLISGKGVKVQRSSRCWLNYNATEMEVKSYQ